MALRPTAAALLLVVSACGSEVRDPSEPSESSEGGGGADGTSTSVSSSGTPGPTGTGGSSTGAEASASSSAGGGPSSSSVGGGSTSSAGGAPGAGGEEPVGSGGAGGVAEGSGGAGGESGVGGAGGSCGDEGSASPERITACGAWAAAFCDYVRECLPALDLLATWGGDRDRCVAAFAHGCEEQAFVNEPAFVACQEALAVQYATSACIATYPLPLPEGCAPYGAHADGEGCSFESECAGGACERDRKETCGVCATAGWDGDACTSDDECYTSRTCIDGTCAIRVGEGSTCDSDGDCATGECTGGLCVPIPVAHEGDPCDEVYCDPTEELDCDDDLLVCVANPTPAPGLLGEPCVVHRVDYFDADIDAYLCEPGTFCMDDVCVAAPPFYGQACGDDDACQGSSCEEGICTAPPAGIGCFCN